MTKQLNKFKTDDGVLALSWDIACEPKLYRQLAPNPYSAQSIEIISKRFPDKINTDIILAVVLAEPVGKYDRNFKLLKVERQAEEFLRQIDINYEICERLDLYRNSYYRELNQMPKELVYKCLSQIVFEANDFGQIEEKYSQNQRRELRLLIINIIENDRWYTPQVSGKKPAHKRKFLGAAAAVFVLLLFFCLSQSQVLSALSYSNTADKVIRIKTQKENYILPARLKIPSINLDAAVESVGLTTDGAMEVPRGAANTGWFEPGARPGQMGSAVIAGHLNSKNGQAGVFSNLNKLKVGDKISVEDIGGKSIVFIVSKSRTYDFGSTGDVFNSSDGVHLNLITCDGWWDSASKNYTKRLVVFADIEH